MFCCSCVMFCCSDVTYSCSDVTYSCSDATYSCSDDFLLRSTVVSCVMLRSALLLYPGQKQSTI